MKDISQKVCIERIKIITHRDNKNYLGHIGIPGLWTQELDAGLWTLESEPWTLNSGSWIMDTEFWTLDAGLKALDSGLLTLDFGLWTLDTIFDCFRTKSAASF